jgi:HlyD family secretion protein
MRKLLMALVGAGMVGALVWALWPQPLAVDLVTVSRGPMEAGISAEGITRVREPFRVVAPITGTTTRAPVAAGDSVMRDETVVAVIQPAEPAFLDARSRRSAEAAVTEAEAAVQLAQTNLEQAEAELDYAAEQLERNRALSVRGLIAQRVLEDSIQSMRRAEALRTAAGTELDLHRATLDRARAQLMGPAGIQGAVGAPSECCVQILAPHSGTVLWLADPSARIVLAGEPLLTIGDLSDLEIELALLSQDAVTLAPGARAVVERWGGAGELDAVVRRIEPSAFTRVSALGIEEQRVLLRLDLTSPREIWQGLGDQFRVSVRVILWSEPDLLRVPQSALFRHDAGWAVFVQDPESGSARLTEVDIGRQAGGLAEVLSGLIEGNDVVVYPASALFDGAKIVARDAP